MMVREAAIGAVGRVSSACIAQQRRQLTEWETYFILKHWQIPVAPAHLAADPEQAILAAKQLGGKVVLKIVSPDIGHKSDAGCVKGGLTGADAVAKACAEVLANAKAHNPQARIDGLLVQEMVPAGLEIIAGGTRDSSFGPVLMVGLGGIFTEIFKDVSFRLAPVTSEQAERMLRELKGFPLLNGARGREPLAIGALVQTLVNLSRLLEAWPQLQELDLNPLIVSTTGVVAVDGLATLRE